MSVQESSVGWESVETLVDPMRIGAFVSLLGLTLAYLQVFRTATATVGTTDRLLVVVVLAGVLAVLLAGLTDVRTAGIIAAVGFTVGMGYYAMNVAGAWALLMSAEGLLRNTLALMTGYSILTIVAVDLWAISVAPWPVFLSWYLAVRARYAASAGVGLAALLFFVLTGDAGTMLTLLGVLGAAGTVGFGELARQGASIGEIDLLAILFALMLITSLSVSVIPGGGAAPINPHPEGLAGVSTEDALLRGDGQVRVTGQPSLDPTVRFTIEAEEGENWRVDAYDRYTGDGWIQSGEDSDFTGAEEPPNAVYEQIGVNVEFDGVQAMPAHWAATDVSGVAGIDQSPADGLSAAAPLAEGDAYIVESARPDPSTNLSAAGTEYPSHIEERYTQLPETTPERVTALTDQIVEPAESPYEAAQRIEHYIMETNEYNLSVDPPSGDIADAQLFERDAGYCTYFATTMAVMLRTQDIPARMVTGYSTGEAVDENSYVVRGMNAHAWVEVYFPEVGWVSFDPTPSDAYNEARQERLSEARSAGAERVDTDATDTDDDMDLDADDLPDIDDAPDNATEGPVQPGSADRGDEFVCDDPTVYTRGILGEDEVLGLCDEEQIEQMHGINPGGPAPGDARDQADFTFEGIDAANVSDDTDTEDEPTLPPVEHLALLFALIIGGVASIRHGDLPRRVRRTANLRWQGRQKTTDDAVIRAWDRIEGALEEEFEARRPGESVRGYVDRLSTSHAIDDRMDMVVDAYEIARYADESVPEWEAATIVTIADEHAGRALPFGR